MSKSSYRKLHVDGVDYKYVIGKSFVKIVRPHKTEIVEREKLGVKCYQDFVTTPGMIASYIRGKDIVAEDYFHSCRHEGAKLSVDPYASEIHGKTYYVIRCKQCLDQLAFDI